MKIAHVPLSRRLFRSEPELYNPLQAYLTGRLVSYGGKLWQSATDVPRGLLPAGVGDGSVADRDLLLNQRGGYASIMGVTGGYAGATYTVTSTADSGTGSLRSALESSNAYWVVFDKTVFPPGVETTITLTSTLTPLPNKTVDGRGSKVFITSNAQILIQGLGNYSNAATAFIRYPSGVANMIFTHARWNCTSSNMNRDCFTVTLGTDGVWFNHCAMTGGTDGTIDISQPDGNGQGVASPLFGNPNSINTRVHMSWCQFGPMPTNANLAQQGALTGGDNLPENGKTNLWGLINDTPDRLWVSADHCWWDGCVQRNPKMWYGMHGHVYNSMTSRWSLVPGVVQNAGQKPAYQALGKTGLQTATYGSVATEVSTGAKVLLENNIYKPYQTGDPHVLDASWPVLYPDLDAINSDAGTTGLRTSGNLYLYGATHAADTNTGSVETRPYSYTLFDADATLQSDLQTGVGNFQPWTLAS